MATLSGFIRSGCRRRCPGFRAVWGALDSFDAGIATFRLLTWKARHRFAIPRQMFFESPIRPSECYGHAILYHSQSMLCADLRVFAVRSFANFSAASLPPGKNCRLGFDIGIMPCPPLIGRLPCGVSFNNSSPRIVRGTALYPLSFVIPWPSGLALCLRNVLRVCLAPCAKFFRSCHTAA